jgi:hypothetical protein
MRRETKESEELADVMALYNHESQRWDIKIEHWLCGKVQQVLWLLNKCDLSEPSAIPSKDWRLLLDVTTTRVESRAGFIKEEYAVTIQRSIAPLIAEIEALKLHLKNKRDAQLEADLQKLFDDSEKPQ